MRFSSICVAILSEPCCTFRTVTEVLKRGTVELRAFLRAHARAHSRAHACARPAAQYGGMSAYQSPSDLNARQKARFALSSSSESSMLGT